MSGKTTFLNELSKKGINTFHVDKFVSELYKPGQEGYKRVIETFGPHFVNEEGIDKNELTKAVILDRSILEKLNMIVMPLIQEELKTPGLQVIEASGMPIPFVDKKVMIKSSLEEVKRRFAANSPQVQQEVVEQLYKKWDNNIEVDMEIDTSYGVKEKDVELFIETFIK